MKKYYAVAIGRISGIYNSWEEAKIQVDLRIKERNIPLLLL